MKKKTEGLVRKLNYQDRGFTLVELLIVIAVIGVLASIIVPNLGWFFGNGKDEADATEINVLQSSMDTMMAKDSLSSVTATVATNDMSNFPSNSPLYPRYLKMSATKAFYSCTTSGMIISAGTSGSTPSPLFSSNLNSLAGFTSLMGSWTAGGGVLSTVKDQNRLVANGGPWGDFTFQATATLVSGNGYGMYYRCDSNPNVTGYIFQFDPGACNRFIVRKVIAGYEFAPFQMVDRPAGLQVNGQHNVSISVVGDHHVIKVDGALVLDFHDSQYSSGTVGLRSWASSKVNFTDFKVSP